MHRIRKIISNVTVVEQKKNKTTATAITAMAQLITIRRRNYLFSLVFVICQSNRTQLIDHTYPH